MDYETFADPKEIRCILTVYEPDVANRSIIATLVVIIEDINDNSPVFSQNVRIVCCFCHRKTRKILHPSIFFQLAKKTITNRRRTRWVSYVEF